MQLAFGDRLRRIGSVAKAAILARSEAVQSAYEAGSQSRRAFGWQAPSASPNVAVLSTLASLRDRSRTATRNNGYAKGAIDKLVTNIIGTGIKPMSQAVDKSLRKQIDALWLKWTDESDADGLLDFYGQQAQAVRGFLEAGDEYIRLRARLPQDGLTVPLQLQVLEPELCPYTYNLVLGTNRVRAGIEFDQIGRRARERRGSRTAKATRWCRSCRGCSRS
jgi:capsid protein